jgi:hypothetical protein|tara:strand:- start:3980 stop:4192 length:213 start_codon:yes stop_codon:yes gene_type:complete
MDNTLKLGLRGLIYYYESLLKNGVVQKNGAAHQRLKELRLKYEQRTGWVNSYKIDDKQEMSFGWLKKTLN